MKNETIDISKIQVAETKPSDPSKYDTYKVEVDETVYVTTEGDGEKTGKTHTEYYVWNGVGWANITGDKDEKITFNE